MCVAMWNEYGEAQLWSVWFNGHMPNLINSSLSSNNFIWASWICHDVVFCSGTESHVMICWTHSLPKWHIKGNVQLQYKIYCSHLWTTEIILTQIIIMFTVMHLQWKSIEVHVKMHTVESTAAELKHCSHKTNEISC